MHKKFLVEKTSPTEAPVRHFGPVSPVEALIEIAYTAYT